jgi:hypothetical protein
VAGQEAIMAFQVSPDDVGVEEGGCHIGVETWSHSGYLEVRIGRVH